MGVTNEQLIRQLKHKSLNQIDYPVLNRQRILGREKCLSDEQTKQYSR